MMTRPYVPRHWDKDEGGNTLPNKWRQWRSFAEQGYLNELGSREVRKIAVSSGFEISRFERHGVMNSRKGIGAVTNMLASIPFLGDFLTSYVVMELRRI